MSTGRAGEKEKKELQSKYTGNRLGFIITYSPCVTLYNRAHIQKIKN